MHFLSFNRRVLLIILCPICCYRRKKGKLKDKIVPQKVRELVPESQSYMDLLAFERKLDATIMRKRLDIQEALKRPIKVSYRFFMLLFFIFTF